jgi:hypothetical protein
MGQLNATGTIPPRQATQLAATSITYPGTAASVSAARGLVRRTLAGALRVDDTELIAAELMSNAIRHTPSGQDGGTFTLTIQYAPGLARIEVGDLGGGTWHPPPCDSFAEYGRGLAIVTALADEWGAATRTPGPGGADAPTQVIWAEVAW